MDKTKLWHINANKIFSNLSEKNKSEIASKSTGHSVRKKDFVYSAGDKAGTVYMLKEGRIRIMRYSEDGRELTIDILEPGDIFGELSMTGEQERETNAVAMEDSLICAIKRRDFEDFIGKMPELSLSITKWMGIRLRRIENRLGAMVFQDVRTRLIVLLRDLSQRHGAPADNGRRIELLLSHKDIAALIGASRETVTLELNNLKRSNDVLMDGRYFIIPPKHLS
ncbi:MAG: Crp/Fnr family transcriptional regulator [Deltaproteobacteria bacterium]|nr:Crp/Fnr family transcriptional regulator [Deltaproteobacteria bacterium]